MKKFRKNKKSGVEIIHEVFELKYERDRYVFEFTPEEKEYIAEYKKLIKYDDRKVIAGFNTGCSELLPNKKMTIEQHIFRIKKILKNKWIGI